MAVRLRLLPADGGIGIEVAQADMLQLVAKGGLLLFGGIEGVQVDVEGAVVVGEGGGTDAAVGKGQAPDIVVRHSGLRRAVKKSMTACTSWGSA